MSAFDFTIAHFDRRTNNSLLAIALSARAAADAAVDVAVQ